MLAASQEIDSFIERQRSKLNKQPSQAPMNRPPAFQPPPQQFNHPPPRQSSLPPSNIEERLDFKVARILDEPPPRLPPQPSFHPPPPPPPPPAFPNNPGVEPMNFFPEQRRFSNESNEDNSASFFSRFGAYDDKRSQLNHELKREYNEYLQSRRGVTKSKSSSQLVSPRGNASRHVQFQQQGGKVVAPWERNDGRSAASAQHVNNVSSTVTTTEYAVNRSRAPTSIHHDEQFIRDREEYILELQSQIRELELRRKQMEIGTCSVAHLSSS